MSTASLPSYHFEPQESEQRLAHRLRYRRPQGNFVKNSRSGGVALRLTGQHGDATLPEYGRGAFVDGTVELKSVESVQSVEVKIDGALRLKEIAEGGTNTSSLCLDVKTLWSAGGSSSACPTSLAFSLTIPTTYSDGKATYPLPPTYEEHLSGVPGFYANILYSVSVTVVRRKTSFFSNAHTTVTTPFVFRPRSRPAVPVPTSLAADLTHPSAIFNEDWALHRGTMRAKSPRGDDVVANLYLPTSHVFCMADPIPFHLFLLSSAFSLAAFLPFAPATSRMPSPGSHASEALPLPLPTLGLPVPAPVKQGVTRMQLLRQTAVDVRSITKRAPLPLGNNTDIWRTVQIGEGAFRRYDGSPAGGGGGQDWMAWYGEVRVDRSVKVAGFKASGLTVKDYIVLTMNPPDPGKSPFMDMRLVIPVKLTTDPWSSDEYGDIGIAGNSDPGDTERDRDRDSTLDYAPELSYGGH